MGTIDKKSLMTEVIELRADLYGLRRYLDKKGISLNEDEVKEESRQILLEIMNSCSNETKAEIMKVYEEMKQNKEL